MATFMDLGEIERLAAYFSEIGDLLGRERRRASFAVYAMGLLGDRERKSNEPMLRLPSYARMAEVAIAT